MARSDPQQERVYAWEDTFRSFGERTATRATLRSLIRRACRKYGVPSPNIGFRSKAESAPLRIASDYDPSTHVIMLGWSDCNHAVAVHEAAHAILDYQELEIEDHGPEFLGLYLDLLVWAEVAPRSALEASAKEAGLKWKKS